jgi:hypothetical protein
MAKVRLQRSGVVTIVCQLVAAGMPQRVGMGLDPKIGRRGRAFDHPREVDGTGISVVFLKGMHDVPYWHEASIAPKQRNVGDWV